MKDYPTTRFVFDRKKNATRTKDALIQIEVLLNGKKKYISTGVRVYVHEWDEKKHIVRRNDAARLNKEIETRKYAIDSYIDSCKAGKAEFSFEMLGTGSTNGNLSNRTTFIDWVADRIERRRDIRETTKKTHRKLPTSLLEYGKMTTFSDVTKANVRDYYEWLQNRKTPNGERIVQSTVWSYMKFLKVYVHEAMARDLILSDPFIGLKVKKGEAEQYRWLSEDELRKIESTEITNKSLDRVRNLFLLQCYTGLAYTDLMDLSIGKIEKDDEDEYIIGRRIKTHEEYIILLIPKAKEILEKYEYQIPQYTNQQYNMRLKEVAKKCEIDKPISSHWGRRTAGMIMLNNGVRLEVVSRVLGHSSVKTTEACYASILRKTVVSEMKIMIKNQEDARTIAHPLETQSTNSPSESKEA